MWPRQVLVEVTAATFPPFPSTVTRILVLGQDLRTVLNLRMPAFTISPGPTPWTTQWGSSGQIHQDQAPGPGPGPPRPLPLSEEAGWVVVAPRPLSTLKRPWL